MNLRLVFEDFVSKLEVQVVWCQIKINQIYLEIFTLVNLKVLKMNMT